MSVEVHSTTTRGLAAGPERSGLRGRNPLRFTPDDPRDPAAETDSTGPGASATGQRAFGSRAGDTDDHLGISQRGLAAVRSKSWRLERYPVGQGLLSDVRDEAGEGVRDLRAGFERESDVVSDV